jgi:hypothetical protein
VRTQRQRVAASDDAVLYIITRHMTMTLYIFITVIKGHVSCDTGYTHGKTSGRVLCVDPKSLDTCLQAWPYESSRKERLVFC